MREETPVADYAVVKDAKGRVCGVWLRNPEEILKNPYTLETLAMKHEWSEDTFELIASKNYRVVRNTYDDAGGSLVMFGSARAPGER